MTIVNYTKAGKPVTHGRISTYVNHGCRCDDCRRVNAEHHRAQREKRELRQDSLPASAHGKASTYTNWGCRCEACKDAHKAQMHQDHERRLAKTHGPGVPAHIPHGRPSTYKNWGCRCNRCGLAVSEQRTPKNSLDKPTD